MLEIINGEGIALELGDDTRIVVERSNPLFSDTGEFFQDITYPGTAPLTPINKRFVSSGHLVEADNAVYELPATAMYGGRRLYAGMLRYKILDREISFTLYVNWGEVAELAKTTKLTDFDFGDAFRTGLYVVPSDAEDSIANPQNYNFAYFPVMHHDYEAPTGGAKIDFFANPWSFEDQAFEAWSAPTPTPPEMQWQRRWCPHFKLKYVLRRALEFLGFTPEGPIWTDSDFDKIYIHSEASLRWVRQSANNYLPALTISEFLGQVKDRLRVFVLFDSIERKAVVWSFDGLIESENVQDLSPYITEIDEISTPERKGYAVSLTPFEQDVLYTPEGSSATPAYKLIVGNGENEVKIPVSTLYDKVEPAGYSYPYTGVERSSLRGNSLTRKVVPDDANAWPMRLLSYSGLKHISGSKYWPEATSIDITIADAPFYRFLNDSKLIKITGLIPATVMSQIDVSKKLGVTSHEGTSFITIPESMLFNLTSSATGLVEFELVARTIVSRYNTVAYIEPIRPDYNALAGVITPVKFVFDTNVYSHIDFEAFEGIQGNPTANPLKIFGEITKSTNPPYYSSGSIAYIATGDDGVSAFQTTILIPNSYPKPNAPYSAGFELSDFIADGDYWRFTILTTSLPDSHSPIIITIP